jgi:hypothetical protein
LPLIHRVCYHLVEKAIVFGSRADHSSHRVLPGGTESSLFKACSMVISTLNFYNTPHVDCDPSRVQVRVNILNQLEDNVKSTGGPRDADETNYLIQLEALAGGKKGGLGRMTTCGYQFIRKDADSTNEFDNHFLFDGVGVAVKLCHHAGVAYYGHLVTHRTAVPLMRSPKKKNIYSCLTLTTDILSLHGEVADC